MDIEIFWDAANHRGDIAVLNGDLATDHDIKTAILISLFSDRRAEDDDPLPDASASKRGWWGDALGGAGEGRRIGSRLWLLAREKQLSEVVAKAKEYAQEALLWLVEDGVVDSVQVDAQIVRQGWLGLGVTVTRPKKSPAKYRFDFAWSNINQGRM